MYHQVTRFKKKTWWFRNTLNDKFCEFLFKQITKNQPVKLSIFIVCKFRIVK